MIRNRQSKVKKKSTGNEKLIHKFDIKTDEYGLLLSTCETLVRIFVSFVKW